MEETSSSEVDYSILQALNGSIVRPKTSVFYLCGLLLVTVAMCILPLLYLALVLGAAYALYYHAVYHWGPIMAWGDVSVGIVILVKFLAYVMPLLIGAVVVFFLFKPIFARCPKGAQPLALNPANEPLLYAFIERICDIVGAPSPRRIDLNCELNASASFRRGVLSFLGNDMVLTIGLPLVANMSARELAGIIAHEFGHFSQGLGMRMSYIARKINFWFMRVVYERDAWDMALEQWAYEEEDGRIAIFVWTAQLGVWFSRLILRIFMYAGFLISGFMLRQMEYDADAYAIKVAGSEACEQSTQKFAVLEAALENTYKDLQHLWERKGQLPDNLPALLRTSHQKLPAHVQRKIDDTLGFRRAGLFDTHPSPIQRIQRARQADDPGIFHDDQPAATLFSSFEYPSRFVTLLHYTDDLGIPIVPEMLVPVQAEEDKMPGQRAKKTMGAGAVETCLMGLKSLLLPLRLETPEPSADLETDYATLNQLTAALKPIHKTIAPIPEQYQRVSERMVQARVAMRLAEAGAPWSADDLQLDSVSSAALQERVNELQAEERGLRHSVHEVSDAIAHRLQLIVSLALADRGEAPDVGGVDGGLAKLVERLNTLADEYPRQAQLSEELKVLGIIKEQRQSQGETPALSRAMALQLRALGKLVSDPERQRTNPASSPTGLRLSTRREYFGDTDLEHIRQENHQWLSDYHSTIEQIAAEALPMLSNPA